MLNKLHQTHMSSSPSVVFQTSSQLFCESLNEVKSKPEQESHDGEIETDHVLQILIHSDHVRNIFLYPDDTYLRVQSKATRAPVHNVDLSLSEYLLT